MNKEKIAILFDSGSDVPKEYAEKYGMYMVPLKILYVDGREYLDGITISPEEVYQSLTIEIPKTSLPSGEEIVKIFDKIKADGYEKVIAVTISSGLSGTNNMVALMASQYQGLDVFVLDTKNISIGAGMHAIQAAKYIEQGMSFEEIKGRLVQDIPNSKVYFCISTLEYLQKGGRIGLVASLVGNILHLKPIISCNDEGIYYNVDTVRGRKHSIHRMTELALEFIPDGQGYSVVIASGGAAEEASAVKKELEEKIQGYELFLETQISPALGVHTGAGLVGIGVYKAS